MSKYTFPNTQQRNLTILVVGGIFLAPLIFQIELPGCPTTVRAIQNS